MKRALTAAFVLSAIVLLSPFAFSRTITAPPPRAAAQSAPVPPRNIAIPTQTSSSLVIPNAAGPVRVSEIANPPATTNNDADPHLPVSLSIPSIGLRDNIEYVGINAEGEMDVPRGTTNDVGWYRYGTIPGNTGSAVIDAHVFAAFANLKYLKPGNDVYVTMTDGTKLRFAVTGAETYPIAQVPLQTLFNRAGGKWLNLITCAGNLTPDHSTYDHRLVVYTELIN